MRKRIFSYLWIGCFCLSFIGCGTRDENTEPLPTVAVQQVENVTSTDKNDMEENEAVFTSSTDTLNIFSTSGRTATVKTEGLCEVLEQKDVSKQVQYNAFNRMVEVDKYGPDSESLFCIDDTTGAVYFVNQGNDEYLYRMKDGEVKLAVEMPVKEICTYQGSVYFMVDRHVTYVLEGMKQGDIYCYTPATGKVELIYPFGAIEPTGRSHKLTVNEKGLYFSYEVIESSNAYQTVMKTYFYHLPFGETEPVRDYDSTTYHGWKNYYIYYTSLNKSGLCLMSRTKALHDLIPISDDRGDSCIINDTICFATEESVNWLNLETGEKQQYDFSEIIKKVDIERKKMRAYLNTNSKIDTFLVLGTDIWVSDKTCLYHLDLKTGESNWYELWDEEYARHDITNLYTDGTDIYFTSARFSGVKRILVDKQELNYIDGVPVVHLKVEDVVK